ncbi:MAG: Squalene/phytoene synthase [uncultured bacterium]|nr:MAG: Squalene/phytoene synthase [uncultured bacterium]
MEMAQRVELIPSENDNTRMIETASLKEAYDFCLNLAQNHYENFPVASLLVPAKLRPHIAAVYAFARIADDFADEAEYEGLRMARLKDWETQLKNMVLTTPTHPVFIALKNTVEVLQIPLQLFLDLLTAFKMDVVVSRYQSFEQLLNYCRYSANPVGRLVLYIMGYPAPKFLEYSDYICTALQLANFWQDVSIDLEKNRVYLPKEDLLAFHYSEEELFKKTYNDNFKRLILYQVERTQDLFNKGQPLCAEIKGRFGLELKLTWLGGSNILDKIRASSGEVFNHRPKLTKKDFIKFFLKCFQKSFWSANK